MKLSKTKNLLKKVLLKPLAKKVLISKSEDDNASQITAKDKLLPNGVPNGSPAAFMIPQPIWM